MKYIRCTKANNILQQVIAGIHEIMSTMTNLTDDIHVGEEHTGTDADAIVEAYRDVGISNHNMDDMPDMALL